MFIVLFLCPSISFVDFVHLKITSLAVLVSGILLRVLTFQGSSLHFSFVLIYYIEFFLHSTRFDAFPPSLLGQFCFSYSNCSDNVFTLFSAIDSILRFSKIWYESCLALHFSQSFPQLSLVFFPLVMHFSTVSSF